MTIVKKLEPVVLLIGDLVFLTISLWLMLVLRYLEVPTDAVFMSHFIPFSILFLVWVVVYFIAGLYERTNSMMRRALPATLFQTQVVNSMIAVLFFYAIPFFGITPKTNLFIYLIVSLGLLLIWRLVLFSRIMPRTKIEAMLIARGEEMRMLREEINNGSYGYTIARSLNLDSVESISVQEDIVNEVYSNNISTVVIDTKDDTVLPLLPHFYNLMFSNVTFVDMHEIYEQIFGRIPLSLVKHGWFLENVRTKPHVLYDTSKRLMDIFIAIILGILSLFAYPIVILGTKISDGGPIFFIQKRTGKGNKTISILKFRTMLKTEHSHQVTRFGALLRATRIDELPQLWNVVKGDLSLIGPRPEIPDLVESYRKEIPYYNVRHLIKPGLSGWAQIHHENHPHHNIDIEATREKLAYDLYYIKNRSFLLDLKIALQTIKTIISHKGK